MPDDSPGTGTAATAQQEAYAFLRSRILGGAIRVGTRIDIAGIAEALGISRMPVREALRQLDTEGLVTIRPNRGAVVATLTPAEIEEHFLMRAALEPLALRLAMPRFAPSDMAELRFLAERLEEAEAEPEEWIRRHKALHEFVTGKSGRRHLAREIRRITEAVEPHLVHHIATYRIAELPGHEHRTLVTAIASGDITTAEQAMRDHVLGSAAGILGQMSGRRTPVPPPA